MNSTHVKEQIRKGEYTGHTSGLCNDFAQFNIVIIPAKFATDFLIFCKKNKVTCPLVLSSKPGETTICRLGDINICTDIPTYWIYKNGVMVEEQTDITDIWQDDFVTVVIGCSFTFELPLIDEKITLLHVEKGKNVSMYDTNIPLKKSQYFSGNMVVSMRWIFNDEVNKVINITKKYVDFHGAPIHIGNPKEIGISDITSPDYGDYVKPLANMQPVFWGCGVSSQTVLKTRAIPFAIAHKPGCMLIGDIKHKDILEKNY